MPSIREILDFIIVPSNFLILLALAGFVLLCFRRVKTARLCAGLSVAGFMIFGYTSAGEVLFAPLVSRFPPHDVERSPAPFGLIILHSGVNEAHAVRMGTAVEFADGGEAVVTAAQIANRFPASRIVVGGGTPLPKPLREVDGIRRILMDFGVKPDRITIDGAAGSTRSAIDNILGMIGPDIAENWWLITSAHRMPRVMGTFRQLGFEPVPVPVDFRWIPPFDPTYVYAFRDGMGLTDDAVHEWAGLLIYWLMGWSDDFLPGAVVE